MKFKFPLEKVMDYRKLTQDLAQRDFQETVNELKLENNKLEKMYEDEHQAQVQAGVFTQKGGAQGPALTQVHDFLRGQKIRIEQQKIKIKEVQKLVETKREILRLAAQDYKIIEKMRENKLLAHQAEQETQDQKNMDEQNILRFKAVKEN